MPRSLPLSLSLSLNLLLIGITLVGWVAPNVPATFNPHVAVPTIAASARRGGSGWLDSLGHSLSGAWRIADYAAVRRVVRLSAYTWSGVWPSSA